jgi:hypothetical protein
MYFKEYQSFHFCKRSVLLLLRFVILWGLLPISSSSCHQVYSIWFFILCASALEHCWVSLIKEIYLMQYSELSSYFIYFIFTQTYEPVLPYHITVFTKTEIWHVTNTTLMLPHPSGALYPFHTVTQRGQSSKSTLSSRWLSFYRMFNLKVDR